MSQKKVKLLRKALKKNSTLSLEKKLWENYKRSNLKKKFEISEIWKN